jgi:hypothetical protein
MPNLTLPCKLPCLLLQANEVASKKGTGAIATAIVQRCAGSDHRFVQCCMVVVLCCTVVGVFCTLHAAIVKRCAGTADSWRRTEVYTGSRHVRQM